MHFSDATGGTMRIFKLTILCLWLSLAGLYAQTESWQWASGAGGPGQDKGEAIAADGNGNYYVAGHFSGTAQFGSFSLTAGGQHDLFLGKINSDGAWLWVRQAGGADSTKVYPNAVTVSSTGSIYVVGSFMGDADFGPHHLTNTGYYDIFVARLDSGGIWQSALSAAHGGDYADCRGLALDSEGNVYLSGVFYSTASFPGLDNLVSLGGSDAFVAKLDAAGNWLWVSQVGGIDSDEAFRLALDSAGNILVVGSFLGTANFGSLTSLTSTSSDAHDIFIGKLNPAGNWLWVRQGGGNGTDWGVDTVADAAGNIYISGLFRYSATFGPEIVLTASQNAAYEMYVAKLNANGTWLWARQVSGYISTGAMCLDPLGSIYVAGSHDSPASFGPEINITNGGDWDLFVGKLSPEGVWQAAASAGGTGFDLGLAICSGSANTVCLTGLFNSTASFGAGNSLTSLGGEDIFVAQYGLATTVEDPSVNAPLPSRLGQNYPNPFNPSTTISLQINGHPADYLLAVYDIKGRRVATLIDGRLEPGQRQLVWNGLDDSGRAVSSGIYFYRLSGAGITQTRKMILCK